MSAGTLYADFIDSGRGRIFVTARFVDGSSNAVLIVPPFAEEMNKSRRMVAELSQALAQRGVATIVPDLYGTGDSEGEFRDATVSQWVGDLKSTIAWAARRGLEIRSVVAIRFGSLLAAELAKSRAVRPARTILWQPIADASRMIDQFLRLRVAAQMMADKSGESIASLREKLRAETLEVAGYELTAALVSGVEALKLSALADGEPGQVDWVEILRSADASVGVASQRAIEALRAAGSQVALHTTVGDSFWMATEIVTSPATVAKTVELVTETS